ncbi:hypothetical protein [Burkholderia cepacia]|uniref:hypothetical protein n=1 Tax=Burkholderia cepacia TaxID=292 RepID=UPI000AF9CE18|nr:hypothetical protein [Burkholderia cepacia]
MTALTYEKLTKRAEREIRDALALWSVLVTTFDEMDSAGVRGDRARFEALAYEKWSAIA